MSASDELDLDQLDHLMELARAEDFDDCGDVTTALISPERADAQATWELVARTQGCWCGAAILPAMLRSLAPDSRTSDILSDGTDIGKGTVAGRLHGRT